MTTSPARRPSAGTSTWGVTSGYDLERSSVIYKTTILPDGTGLDAFSVAAELPSGEEAGTLHGHLGIGLFIFGLTRDEGPAPSLLARFAEPLADGSLVIGERFADGYRYGGVGTTTPASVAVSVGRFVYLAARTQKPFLPVELVRIDPSVLNGSAPAWAPDVATSNNSSVYHAVLRDDGLVGIFTLDGKLNEQSATKVASGTIELGSANYGIASTKFFAGTEIVTEEGTATISTDGVAELDSFTSITPTLTLTRGADDDACVTAATIKALPAPEPIDLVTLPLLCFDRERVDEVGVDRGRDTRADRTYLQGKRNQIIDFQEGSATYTAQVLRVDWVADSPSESSELWQGTALVTLKVLT